MITIKSHFSFSGINIPSTVTCSITSYFKGDTFIQDIDFPTTLITEPLGQNYIKTIIINNLEPLENYLITLRQFPNDSEIASKTIELFNAIKQINKHLLPNNQIFDLDSYNPTIQNLLNNLTKLAELHAIPVNNTQLKIYQHPRMGDTLTYHESDFNYYITYSQYLD